MPKSKKLYIVLSAAAVLVIAGALLVFNANRILKLKIESTLGKDFTIERISLGLGGVDAYGIKLTKNNETVLTIDKLSLRANLFGFLKKHYSISSLTAQNPVVHIVIDKNGEIEDLLPGGKKEQAAAPIAFGIGHISITGGTLYLIDKGLPSPYDTIEVDNRSLELDNLFFPLRPEQADVRLSVLIKGKLASGDLKCDGNVNLARRSVDIKVSIEDLALADEKDKGPAVRVKKMDFAITSSQEAGNHYVIPDLTLYRPFFRVETDRQGDFVKPVMVMPASHGSGQSGSSLLIKKMTVTDGALDYFDGKVSSPPHLTRLQSVSLAMTNAAFPFDNRLSSYALTTAIPGRSGAALLQWNGKTNFKNVDTDAQIELKNLDITGFKPYFQKKGDADISRGLLDLTMRLQINNRMINSPGKAVLRDLEFSQGKGIGATFIGVPRSLVLKLLKSSDNAIALDFVIAGNLGDPKFNLRENFVKRFTVGLAERLGLTVVGAGKTVVELGEKGVSAVGKGLQSIGEGIGSIFKKKKN